MGYFLSLFSFSKSATETALNVAELVIIISGLLLAFGAVGEYLEEHHKLPRWMGWPKIIFIVLVVVSLLGEFLGDAGVFIFSSHLQTIEDLELSAMGSNAEQLEARLKTVGDKATRAESTAGAASTKSSKAVVASGNALRLARGARKEADTFEKDIKSAKTQAADALANLAEAKRLADEARQGTARNTEKLADRTLSPAQQTDIATRLRPFGPQQVDVIIIGDLPEITNITVSIILAMQQAGWTVKPAVKAIAGPAVAGVRVGTKIGSSKDIEDSVDALILALRAAGIFSTRFVPQFGDELPMAIMGNWDSKNVAPIRILVGAKP